MAGAAAQTRRYPSDSTAAARASGEAERHQYESRSEQELVTGLHGLASLSPPEVSRAYLQVNMSPRVERIHTTLQDGRWLFSCQDVQLEH